MKIEEIEIGSEVSYGFYGTVIYKGMDDEGHVLLEDKQGNPKKVFKSLFRKYGRVK